MPVAERSRSPVTSQHVLISSFIFIQWPSWSWSAYCFSFLFSKSLRNSFSKNIMRVRKSERERDAKARTRNNKTNEHKIILRFSNREAIHSMHAGCPCVRILLYLFGYRFSVWLFCMACVRLRTVPANRSSIFHGTQNNNYTACALNHFCFSVSCVCCVFWSISAFATHIAKQREPIWIVKKMISMCLCHFIGCCRRRRWNRNKIVISCWWAEKCVFVPCVCVCQPQK